MNLRTIRRMLSRMSALSRFNIERRPACAPPRRAPDCRDERDRLEGDRPSRHRNRIE
jgi:hypothetical protein